MYLLEYLQMTVTLIPAFLINQKYSPDPQGKKEKVTLSLRAVNDHAACSFFCFFFLRGTMNEVLMNAFSWSASATNVCRARGKLAPGAQFLSRSGEQQRHFAVTSWAMNWGFHCMGWRGPVCNWVCCQHSVGCSWHEYLGRGARKYSQVLADRHGQNARCL